MLSLIFTLDYEIHGNGEGCPNQLIVEPTDRLLRLLNQYGAKLTIMADVAEILKFKQYKEQSGRDAFFYEAIAEQLRHAIRSGHDVQLHLHSSYFNARHEQGRWVQDWSEYSFAGLPYERMTWMVREGKRFLEELLRPVAPDYLCMAFRAANWSVHPSEHVGRALLENGIFIDTSIFKFGQRRGLVNFDYSSAHDALRPWRADLGDFCRRNDSSRIWEFPIYSESRAVGAFLTPNRVYRALLGRAHKIADPEMSIAQREASVRQPPARRASWLLRKHAWKADFNQCSGRQLIAALRRADRGLARSESAPFVMIGHSKLFTRWNERSLRPLLRFVQTHPDRFGFGTLSDYSPQVQSNFVDRN